jgi:hypothetical protein
MPTLLHRSESDVLQANNGMQSIKMRHLRAVKDCASLDHIKKELGKKRKCNQFLYTTDGRRQIEQIIGENGR